MPDLDALLKDGNDEPQGKEKPQDDGKMGNGEATATDEWTESDHPRKDNGQFGTGSGTKTNSGKQASETDKPQKVKPLKEFLGQEYTGVKGQAAVEKLLQEKQGHVKGAFTRQDIGDIDLVWGDEEKGLAHLIKRREDDHHYLPKDILDKLTDTVEKGQLKKNEEGKYEIWHDRVVIIVAPDYNGSDLRWVITGFKQRKP